MKKSLMPIFLILLSIFFFSYSQDNQKVINNSSSYWTLNFNNQVINIEPNSAFNLTNIITKDRLNFYALEMVLRDGPPYIIKHGFVSVKITNNHYDLEDIEKIPIYLVNSSSDLFIEHKHYAYLIQPFEKREIKNAFLQPDSTLEIKISVLNDSGEILNKLIKEYKVSLESDKGYLYLPCF